jgi:hypothetical protein
LFYWSQRFFCDPPGSAAAGFLIPCFERIPELTKANVSFIIVSDIRNRSMTNPDAPKDQRTKLDFKARNTDKAARELIKTQSDSHKAKTERLRELRLKGSLGGSEKR